ncbi:hypothetical protein [Actinomadura keratinilytica]|uniref:hypothetical protein n=1 Tax=Actinomadura keratinilytica TaxID=547461 RepID=UPI0036160B19
MSFEPVSAALHGQGTADDPGGRTPAAPPAPAALIAVVTGLVALTGTVQAHTVNPSSSACRTISSKELVAVIIES